MFAQFTSIFSRMEMILSYANTFHWLCVVRQVSLLRLSTKHVKLFKSSTYQIMRNFSYGYSEIFPLFNRFAENITKFLSTFLFEANEVKIYVQNLPLINVRANLKHTAI